MIVWEAFTLKFKGSCKKGRQHCAEINANLCYINMFVVKHVFAFVVGHGSKLDFIGHFQSDSPAQRD